MEAVAVFTSVVMGTVALVHLYWAFGGVWPAKSTDDLARMVIGHGKMPGFWPTFTVSLLMFGLAAYAPMLVLGVFDQLPHRLVVGGTLSIAAVFLLRMISTFIVPWFLQSSEPFQTLDRWLYAPLCFVLGACYIRLAMVYECWFC